MADNFVAILMGSDSDYPLVENTIAVLKGFGIRYEVKVTSAHRTPEVTHAFVTDAEKRGCGVFICAAGLAAHLAGAVAANTTRPVIGIPVDCGPLNGVDALYSTVMMPGGIPVATVAVGKAGAEPIFAGYSIRCSTVELYFIEVVALSCTKPNLHKEYTVMETVKV